MYQGGIAALLAATLAGTGLAQSGDPGGCRDPAHSRAN
jgi:hypothetical protein